MKDVTGWKPLSGTSGFLGTFDGDGHSISNLNGTLFGTLKGATVKNLAVVDSVVSGADSKSTGILANSAAANSSTPGTIQNCYVTGSVSGKTTGATMGVGGLVGLVSGKTVIRDCAANVTVTNSGTSDSYAGGLVGCVTAANDQLTIERCCALGTVTTGGDGAGGLVGGANASNKTVTIKNSAALQSTVSSKNKYREGRIAGRNITNSSFTNVYGYDGMTSTKQPNGFVEGVNGTDVTKSDCGTVSFWTGLGFADESSVWTVADGKLPKLSSLNAMSGALPSYLAPGITVSGTVKCGEAALVGATVVFAKDGESISATTDTDGKYSVKLAAGSYTVTVSHSGYLTHVETDYAVSGAATKDFSLSENQISLGSDKTVEVAFSTTDAADKIGEGNITIAYSGTGTLSMNDFAVSTSADALKSYNGVTVKAVTAIAAEGSDTHLVVIELAKNQVISNSGKAYLFYKNTCLGELTLSKTINKVQLTVPTGLAWDGTIPGKATWTASEHASGYVVQLYRDNAAQGAAVNTTETFYDFTSVIADSGSYTFKVKATGDDTYADSSEAESGAYAFTEQTVNTVHDAALAALNAMAVSNSTTANEVLKVVTDIITNNKITAVWSGTAGFAKTEASDGADPATIGSISGTIVLSHTDGGTKNITVNLTIAPKYAVTFVAGNSAALGSAPTQETVTAGTEITLPTNPFTVYGKSFNGWSDGTNTYQPAAPYTMPDGNVTFTAQWTEDIWDGTSVSTKLEGKGTSTEPYLITNGADLAYLAKTSSYKTGYYKVVADINMGGHTLSAIAYMFGSFDGDGHKIYNLKITSRMSGADYMVYCGLFEEAGNGVNAGYDHPIIKNLTLDASIDYPAGNEGYVGLLVSQVNGKLTIENCHVFGTINVGDKTGMVVGGLVGITLTRTTPELTISKCSANVTFKGTKSGLFCGLVGMCKNTSIDNSYAVLNTDNVGAGSTLCGIAYSDGSTTIQKCYAVAQQLKGTGIAMGKVTVKNCVSIFPEMTGTRVLAPYGNNANDASGTDNYGYAGSVRRDENGIIVNPDAAQIGADKTMGAHATAGQLKSMDFYTDTVGWSDDIWEIRTDYAFPVLKGQKTVPELTLDLTQKVNSVTLNTTAVTLTCGATKQLSATVDVANGASQTIEWKSSNTALAVVDGSGKVTIPENAASGTVTITATSVVAPTKYAVCTITVDAGTYTLAAQKAANNANSPGAVCSFYATPEDATAGTNAITSAKAGVTVYLRVTGMDSGDVVNDVIVNDDANLAKQVGGEGRSIYSFPMPCQNTTVVFSCAEDIGAYNYTWIIGSEWGTWGETVTYTATDWDNSEHIATLKITSILNGRSFVSFENEARLREGNGYTPVTLTQKNSKAALAQNGDYFVDRSGAYPVLYVYLNGPGQLMTMIKLEEDSEAEFNITQEPTSAALYTLDKTKAKAGETITAKLTEAGIAAMGGGPTNTITLTYYGGLLVVLNPGRFQQDANGEWTTTITMPAQDITTKAYASAKNKVTLTVRDKTVPYTGDSQSINSEIQAKLNGTDVTEALAGRLSVTYEGIGNTVYAATTTAPVAIGTYSCTVQVVEGDTLYYSDTATATLTITKASLNNQPSAPEKESATPNSITLKTPATFADGSTIPADSVLEYRCGENGVWQTSTTFTGLTADTEYMFYARIKETETTAVSAVSAAGTIKTAPKITVTISGLTATSDSYTKMAQKGYTGTLGYSPIWSGNLEETYYLGDGTTKTTATNSGASGDGLAPVNAGSYVVKLAIPDSDPTYTGSITITFEITKRVISVKANDCSMTVNESLPTFDVTYGNFASDDTAETVIGTAAVATTTADGKQVGQFTVDVTTLPTLKAGMEINYEIGRAESGTLAVNALSSKRSGKFTVTVKNTENGSVTADRKNTAVGTTVTITVTPDSGYTLETIAVLDKNGKEIELTNNGNGTYTFKMPAGKVEIAAEFAEEASVRNFFVDVTADRYYYDAVLWATRNGITGGIDENHFGPDLGCTRAQLVTFLWRAAGSPVANYAMSFTDVGDSYYTQAIRWATGLGIVDGYGYGLFGTDDIITREQIATILYRFAQAMKMDTTQGGMTVREFADYASISDYAIDAMQWAVNAGILQGYNNNLSPDQPCIRAQIVTMLYRLLGE